MTAHGRITALVIREERICIHACVYVYRASHTLPQLESQEQNSLSSLPFDEIKVQQVQHLKYDVISDLSREIWSHVRLKGSKKYSATKNEVVQNEPPPYIVLTSGTPRLQKIVQSRNTIKRTTMSNNPKHGRGTETSTHKAAMVGRVHSMRMFSLMPV
ncbi:hypothetical protein J6590_067212 [Homalodisca vitripennis]|nr:hypothetical protein J6590_067212 [Homalodisca vitripennis]